VCDVSRRDFLRLSAAGAAVAGLYAGFEGPPRTAAARARAEEMRFGPAGSPSGRTGMQPDSGQRYDLVIRGGEVVDPSQGLRGLRDVAIHNGRIAAVEASIPAERAKQSLSATGRLVLPGLVDMHSHVFPLASGIGLPADELAPATGTTTQVSAGDAGHNNFGGFDHWVIGQTRTRIFAFVHIAVMGLAGYPVGEMLNIEYADVDLAAKTVAENSDVVLGLKVRESLNVVGENGLEPLRRAIAAAELAGTGARVMCHIGGAPGDLSDLLDLLRPGDILTHSYSGSGNNTVRDGQVLPAALEAKARGVVIDVGHGGGSFDYTVAEPAIDQGLLPDTIGSDVHAVSINTPGMPLLPWVMSKFLNLGFSLEQVVAMATINPARVIDRVDGLGTLRVGAPGDVSIMELVEGPVEFVDTRNNARTGDRFLRPVETVRAGRPFGRPYPAPFTYP
jgi:dihydroorotase